MKPYEGEPWVRVIAVTRETRADLAAVVAQWDQGRDVRLDEEQRDRIAHLIRQWDAAAVDPTPEALDRGER